MQSENYLQSDLTPPELPTAGSRSSKAKILIWIQGITFLLGLGLLAILIYEIGYEKIIASLAAVGWGFAVVLVLNVTRHFCRAASLYLSIEPEHRTTKYMNVVAARFGGEAVNFFSFAGPFLGDATKAVLLKKDMPLTHGASAVIIDNILYYLTVILVILVGVAILVTSFGSGGGGVDKALLLIVVFSLIGFIGLSLAIRFRITPFSYLIKVLEKRSIAPAFLVRKQHHILDVERNVFHFYHDRRADFFKVFGISLGVHALSVAEVFFAIRFLGFDSSISTALITESLTKVINVAFSFVPGTIGVYEGGNEFILQTLGYAAAVGVSLALVRRGAILFSTTVGLIVLLWRGAVRGSKIIAKADE
ncbi:MAG: lysylphosphatidylglycerol synthase domain-containing protein [Pyrinomonadaceae bacterium]